MPVGHVIVEAHAPARCSLERLFCLDARQESSARMCVTAHALLSALIARLEGGGGDAMTKELSAIVGSSCPRSDVERALVDKARTAAPESRSAFERAPAALPE